MKPIEDSHTRPNEYAHQPAEIERHISTRVRKLYDVHSYRHAAAIMAASFPCELEEIERTLLDFSITMRDIAIAGENEKIISEKFSRNLRTKNWIETRLSTDLWVEKKQYSDLVWLGGKIIKANVPPEHLRIIKNYRGRHTINYAKDRVAFNIEWNSKDQAFNRYLFALSAFHEFELISAGVLVTRSASLTPVFDMVPQLNKAGEPELYKSGKNAGKPKNVSTKYDENTTTWMNKLLYRLNAGRNGGCPVLVFGITPKLISDWKQTT